MSLLQIAWKHIQVSSFRSWVIFQCAAFIAGFSISANLLISGAQKSLRLTLDRLGADIIVVPIGAAPRLENAFLMGMPEKFWMPRDVLDEVRKIPGVASASPQLYLSSLRGATCCSIPDMFLIAYDPETDFTLRPWLDTHIEGGLQVGDIIGGQYVFVPADQDRIYLYGYGTNLRGNLAATGTGIDGSVFFTFETAQEISRLSDFQAEQPMEIPEGHISSVLIKVGEETDAEQVAEVIRMQIRDVSVVENASMFRDQRQQILNMLRSSVVVLALIWVLSMALIALLFSMDTHARRREIGVLRALGATRKYIFNTIITEGMVLALGGGLAGIVLYTFVVILFKNLIVQQLGLPFYVPSIWVLLAWGLATLAGTIISVLLSILYPALRISQMEPAIAFRE